MVPGKDFSPKKARPCPNSIGNLLGGICGVREEKRGSLIAKITRREKRKGNPAFCLIEREKRKKSSTHSWFFVGGGRRDELVNLQVRSEEFIIFPRMW